MGGCLVTNIQAVPFTLAMQILRKAVQFLLASGSSKVRRANLIEHTFPIDAAPELPPKGCTCIPWCRCVVIAMPNE